MGEQQGLVEEMFDVVSTLADDAMDTPGTAPQDGRCGELRAPGLDLCQESSPSSPQKGDHGLANPRRTAFHGTVASFSLPETRSTCYSLLLELLFASQGA